MSNVYIENLTLNIQLVTQDNEVVQTIAPPVKPTPTPEELEQQSIRKAVRRMKLIDVLLKNGYSPDFIAGLQFN